MNSIPDPIFKKDLDKISWKKIYDREYGVQYSEAAVSLLAFASYHFPKTSVAQVIIPGEGNNTSFYIDDVSWLELVEGLNKKYTVNVKQLEKYERQFLFDGKNYLKITKKVSKLNLKKLTNKQLLSLFLDHQDKRNKYSVFAWSAFILNNYVADRAVSILEPYIKKHNLVNQKQRIIDALFTPEKHAAVLQLQQEVEKHNGKLTNKQFDTLYEKFNWLSCLDIQNKPWSKEEFRQHIKSFTKSDKTNKISFREIVKKLKPSKKDLEYLQMAKRFVYIKDARDDFRRESVFYSINLWKEIGRRMGISAEDTSYLQDSEIIAFLKDKNNTDLDKISRSRKNGFVIYIGSNKKVICSQGDHILAALKLFKLDFEEEKTQEIKGRVASKGLAKGNVAIVKGVKDLDKVKMGDILIAVTTHPDYVSAMRKAVAIVTDEGGITSHAAIVSREFGIPCIVGTKLATKVLRDGDMVEVDANSGVVKKLN